MELASVQRPTWPNVLWKPVSLDHIVLHIEQRVNRLNSRMAAGGHLTGAGACRRWWRRRWT